MFNIQAPNHCLHNMLTMYYLGATPTSPMRSYTGTHRLIVTNLYISKSLDELYTRIILTLNKGRLSDRELRQLESRLSEQPPETRVRILLNKPLSVLQSDLLQ